ncbi:MAG: TolC family protein [Elusimicrobia bacterium]|jgi:outer membrane protein|nr:TolC family protein [Elusimicrobiota bacterium]
MKTKIKFSVTVFLILLSSEVGAKGLTLNDFLKSAIKRNYEIREAGAAVEKAEGQKAEMWGMFFPQFSASYSKNYINRDQELSMSMPLVTPSGQIVYEEVEIRMGQKENQSAEITANIPVFTFGSIRGAYVISKEALKIENKIYSSKRNNVIGNVKKAFYRVLLAREIVDAARRQVLLMEENLNMTQSLYNSGKASNLDISRVKVHLSGAEGGLIEAESNLEIAKENLLSLSGLKISGLKNNLNAKIEGNLESRDFNYNLEKLIAIAMKNREELAIAEYSISINKENKWLGTAQNLPKFYAYGSYKWERPDIAADRWTDYWVAGARVNFPFLDGLSMFGRNKKNSAAVDKAVIAKEKIRENIKLQVKTSFYNFKKAEKKIKVNQQQLSQARESLEVSNERYARGLLSNLELNGAILDYTNSRIETALSVFNLLSAIEDIKLAAGKQVE